ncbi:MAG: hybrid sensor histidine kinase/response regulator [Chloroflexi bacterium]|nr:hybrid sensor histidine kinase/response regulator [Chloroflexota bacterium]
MSPADCHPLAILVIEDNAGDARLIREMLRDAAGPPCRVESVSRLAAGLQRLAEGPVDAVLLDLSLPDSQGLETFSRLQAREPHIPVVVLSGLDDETVAVRAVQEGAQDYLVKGRVDAHLLRRSLRYAVERQRMAEERAELERQKDEFLGSVSHDLRTPLAAIKASIGVVLAHEPPGMAAGLHRMLANIDLAADQMARLVDDLLELTRLKAGRVRLRVAECDLRALAEQAARAIEPLAEERSQSLELLLPAEPVLAAADAERVERALLNLLGNAQKYGRTGGTIRLSLHSSDGEVIFSVADDGPGIPEPEQGRIFDRFYRAETEATRKTQGSGLGLPIARALVELHGGRIWVESRSGAGATFKIALPAVASATPG